MPEQIGEKMSDWNNFFEYHPGPLGKDNVPHVGVFIKEELDERGWSQRDLAYILDCSEQAVAIIINGKRNINPETAKALAMAFEVSAEFFTNLQKTYAKGFQ
jgi:addiction module HigA family antidote